MPKILRPIRILVPTLLAALAAAGCESSTLSPESIPGTYVLVSYNGQSLPRETASLEDARYYLLADTFKLAANGAGTQVQAVRIDYRNPALEDRDVVSATNFMYEINDDRLRMAYPCPFPGIAPAAPSADVLPTSCVPAPHAIGRVDGDLLLVTTRDAVLRYRRED